MTSSPIRTTAIAPVRQEQHGGHVTKWGVFTARFWGAFTGRLDGHGTYVGAGRHGQPGQQPCTRLAAQRGASPALCLGQPARAPGEGRHQLRYAFSEGLAGTCDVAAIEPPHAQADPDRTPKGRQVGRTSTIAAVHGPASLAAIRAELTSSQAAGSDLQMGQSIRGYLLDPAAGDRTLNVHVLFNGAASRLHQTSVLSRHKPREVRENQPDGTTSEDGTDSDTGQSHMAFCPDNRGCGVGRRWTSKGRFSVGTLPWKSSSPALPKS